MNSPSLAAVVAAALSFCPWSGAAAQDATFVTAQTLRDACRAAPRLVAGDTVSPAAQLRTFCALDLQKLLGTDSTLVPSTAVVNAVATGKTIDSVKSPGSNPPSRLLAGEAFPTQADLVLGFTQFVVDRAKDEARVYLINRFANALCTHTISGFGVDGLKATMQAQAFLPRTCTLLSTPEAKQLLQEGFTVPSWGGLQNALHEDAAGLPDRVIMRVDSFAVQHYGGLQSEATRRSAQRVVALVGAVQLGRTYLGRRDLPRAFRDAAAVMSQSLYDVCMHATPPAAPSTTSISSSTGAGGASCNLDAASWRTLRPAEAMLVSAAVVGMLPSAEFNAWGTSKGDADSLVLYVTKAAFVNARGDESKSVSVVQSALRDFIGATESTRMRGVEAYRMTRVVRGAADSMSAIARGVALQVDDAKGDQRKILAAYAGGVADASGTLSVIVEDFTMPDGDTDDVQQALGLVRRVSRYASYELDRNYSALLADLMTLANEVDASSSDTPLARYALPAEAASLLQFAAAAGQSKDADGFAKVLADYAAPPNAFLRKRTQQAGRSNWYWSLNAYAGVSGGTEWARGAQIPVGRDKGVTYSGLFIPAGVEFGRRFARAGGAGLLLQLIDVGQVASWRFNQSDSSSVKTTPPGLSVAAVFSPGLALVWHVPALPVSLGADYAYAPQFRHLTQSAVGTKPDADVARLTAFIAIDVPLYP